MPGARHQARGSPVDVNMILKERYRLSPEQTLTRAMIWDMETKKAWDAVSYIPSRNCVKMLFVS